MHYSNSLQSLVNPIRVTRVLHVSAGPQQTSWQVIWLCFPLRIPQKHVLCNVILHYFHSEPTNCHCEEKKKVATNIV